MDLSIIIPAYREADRITTSLEALAEYLATHSLGHLEVLVVAVDGPDRTARLSQSRSGLFDRFMVIEVPRSIGKGFNVALGMLQARGRYRLFMDADLATPLHHLQEVRRIMATGTDVAIGVRDLGATHHGVRKLISLTGNRLTRWLVLPGIADTQCGFKLFSARAAQDVFSRQTIVGWGFDIEALVIARDLGYQVRSIDLPDWRETGGGTLTRRSIWGAAMRTLADVLTIRKRSRRRAYGTRPEVPSELPFLYGSDGPVAWRRGEPLVGEEVP